MQLTQAQAVIILRRLGWPVDRIGYDTAVTSYQVCAGLKSDGILGPLTSGTLNRDLARLTQHTPTASLSFSYNEFACKCLGQQPGCAGILVLPSLLRSLEVYAHEFGKPSIVSGYRCRRRNASVGGAQDSQHMYGSAVDVPLDFPLAEVKALGVFSGIGWQRFNGQSRVRHVDVRHASGHNSTNGQPTAPTQWQYGT